MECHTALECYNISMLDDPDNFFCIRCRLKIGEPFTKIDKFLTSFTILKKES